MKFNFTNNLMQRITKQQIAKWVKISVCKLKQKKSAASNWRIERKM